MAPPWLLVKKGLLLQQVLRLLMMQLLLARHNPRLLPLHHQKGTQQPRLLQIPSSQAQVERPRL